MLNGDVLQVRSFLKAIPRSEVSAGDNVEGLEDTVLAGGFEAEGFLALFDEVRGASEALGAVAAALHRGSGERFNVGQKTLLVGGANRSWRIGGDQRQRKNCKDQRGLSPALAQIASLFGWGRGHKHAISPLKDRRVLHQSCQIISVPLVPGLSMFHRGLLGCTTLVA